MNGFSLSLQGVGIREVTSARAGNRSRPRSETNLYNHTLISSIANIVAMQHTQKRPQLDSHGGFAAAGCCGEQYAVHTPIAYRFGGIKEERQ